ncbi:MAG TPA: DUF167 family protein [Rhodocyclaceae bacterium]|nr:DUF167 family protein [Rhodocyclaceae bacterium]
MSWLRQATHDSIMLTLHVQPGAKRTEFVGLHGESLKLRLAAPPVDGKANACLIVFLSEFFKVGRSDVTLVSGEASRHKVVRIIRPDSDALSALLSEWNKS